MKKGAPRVMRLRSVAPCKFEFGKSVPKLEGRCMTWNFRRFILAFRGVTLRHTQTILSSFICNLVLLNACRFPRSYCPKRYRRGSSDDAGTFIVSLSFGQAQQRSAYKFCSTGECPTSLLRIRLCVLASKILAFRASHYDRFFSRSQFAFDLQK